MKLFDYARKNFKVRGRSDNMPRLAKTTRVGLAQMYHKLGLNKGVEVGTREGKHALMLCEQNPNINLVCVDPWHPYGRWTQEKQTMFYNLAVERLKPFNAQLVKKTSMDALEDFEDASLDFSYIDGDHDFDFVCSDIIYWSRKVIAGGIIGVHDYFPIKLGGVLMAVDAYTRAHCINPWYVTHERTPTAFWEKV